MALTWCTVVHKNDFHFTVFLQTFSSVE